MPVTTCPNPHCPDYQTASGRVVKNGRDALNRQRYQCQTCHRTFTDLTSAPSGRSPHQYKQSIPGHKSQRGQGDYYDEPKNRVNLSLTPTATAAWDTMAKHYSLSRSEIVERLGRNLLTLAELAPVQAALAQTLPVSQTLAPTTPLTASRPSKPEKVVHQRPLSVLDFALNAQKCQQKRMERVILNTLRRFSIPPHLVMPEDQEAG